MITALSPFRISVVALYPLAEADRTAVQPSSNAAERWSASLSVWRRTALTTGLR